MSGGANNGAWEVGVLWGLLHYGEPTDFAYDVITGVSAGALNTGMFSTWAKGDELAMTEYTSDSWASIHQLTQIFQLWDGAWPPTEADLVKAFLTEPSLLNTDPAIEFVRSIVAP